MGLEVLAVGKVTFPRFSRSRVGDYVALLVEQQDVTLVRCRGGAIEQGQVTDLRGNVHEVFTTRGRDQAEQGDVIELDVAQDVGFDQLHDVGGGAAG
ncbi:hypothetical protein D9M73_239570 [compost metagenome]